MIPNLTLAGIARQSRTRQILGEFQAEELRKHQRTLAPTSLLIDADRQAMAVYKRAVDFEQVLADMRLFNMNQQ